MLTNSPLISTSHLTKVYGKDRTAVQAVKDLSLDIFSGEFISVMGPSGCGKSTLMHCLAGLDSPTSGQIFFQGKEISALKDKALTLLRRKNIGFIFQQFNLIPTLTAEQNITLPLNLARGKLDRKLFAEIVESLNLQNRLNHLPHQLSGGEQQRVAVARALLTRPSVIFADEPTGALDQKTGAALLTYLAHCNAEYQQTIIMVTHDENAAKAGNRMVRMRDGRIISDSYQEQVLPALEDITPKRAC